MNVSLRFSILLIGTAMAVPTIAMSQTTRPAVPPFEQPAVAVPPARTGEVSAPDRRKADRFASREELVADFADAYRKADKPRLAFFWNRQLGAAFNQWYGESRMVGSTRATNDMVGDRSARQGIDIQQTVELQRRRAGDDQRLQPSEGWEWEFQDGFLAPFMAARATVVDRAAITRLTAVGKPSNDEQTVETRALLGMADLLVEVLVAPTIRSTTGYELRARILDIKTGAIMGYVNSRGLEDWQRQDDAVATSRGFVMTEDLDDEGFGPEKSSGYVATNRGLERSHKPPKLRMISQNLAYNVMKAMMTSWE